MAISDIQKIDWLWKKVGYGVAKTDISTIKSAVNESVASGLLLRADQIWGDAASIPATLPVSSTNIVNLEIVEATADATATPNRTWFSGYENWIPPQFGATYLVNVYVDNAGAADPASTGTKLFAAGSGNNDEWFFDYQSGTLNFIGENLPSALSGSKVIYIQGAVYTGTLGPSSTENGGQFGEVIIGDGGGGSIITSPGGDLDIGAGEGGNLNIGGGAGGNTNVGTGSGDTNIGTGGGDVNLGTGGGTVNLGENASVDPNGNLRLDQIAVNGNRIETFNSDANLELLAAGAGIIDLLSNVATLNIDVTGDQTITGSLDVDTSATIASLNVEDLTAGRVLLAGTDGEIEDSANLTFDGTTLVVTGDTEITGNLTLGGNITIGDADTDSITVAADFESHLIPNDDGTYDLGSDAKRWRSLYVSGSTIYLGGLKMQDNGSGGLVIISEDGSRTNFEASVIDAQSIVVDELELDGNRIRTLNSNADLELTANGTGRILANGVDVTQTEGKVWYVTQNGADSNSGELTNDAFSTVKYALTQATNGDIVYVSAGTFEEVFPLDVPEGVTVRGQGLRATQIKPTAATRDLDGFRVDGGVVIESLTVREMEYNSSNDTGYAFRYKPTASVTIRSAYIKDITVANFGSSVRLGTNASDDPYGFDAGDAGRGALVDGASIAAGSIEPAMLFDSVTFIVPNAVGLIMTNGARVEWLNSFTYFAHEAIKGITGTSGRGGVGKTRITLGGVVGTITAGDTATFTSTDGSTVVTMTVDAVENNTTIVQDGRNDDLEGFDFTPESITFVGGAGATATSILRYDRKEFAAEMRSIASANVYGNFGIVADGPDTSLRMVSHNFGYIGVGKRLDNDDTAVVQANEITETNGGRVYYASVDQRGDFRIGDHFTVDQETGNTTFQGGSFDVTTLTGINFSSGSNLSIVDPFKVQTGNLRLSGNSITSIQGDINLTPAGTNGVNISSDADVSGNLNVGQDLTVTGDTNLAGNIDITGNLTLGGNITIGDQETDSITVAADFESDLVPNETGTYNLGSPSKQWKDFYVENIQAGEFTIEDIRINGNRIETVNSDSNLEIDTAGAGTIELQSDTNITGDAAISGTLDVTGNTTLNSDLAVAGNSSVVGNSSITGNEDIAGALSVTGDTTLSSNAAVAGDLSVAGNETVTGTLGVTGDTTLQVLDAQETTLSSATISDLTAGRVVLAGTDGAIEDSANITFDGTTLGVTGNVDVSGDVTIGGNITIGDADTDAITVAADFESHLIPNEDETYDLGSATKKWRNLYVAGQTIHLGGIQLKEQNGGFIVVDAGGNELDITGGTIFADRLIGEDITIDGNRISTTSSNSNLELISAGTGTLELLSNTNITGEATVSSTFNVTGATTLSSTLGVTGATTLSSTLDVTSSAVLNDTLGVTGVTTLASDANVGGNLAVTGNSTITGNENIAGILSVTGDTTLGSDLAVAGNSTITGNESIIGNLGVTGATTLNSTLDVTGNTSLVGDATVGGTLGVTGEATLASATVSDLTDNRVVIAGTSGSLEDDANFTFDGSTLALTADQTITGALQVTGSFTIDNIDINGSTISSSTGITIDPSPTGAGGTLTVQGDITAEDILTDGLETTGNLTVGGTLGVAGESTLASAIVSDLTAGRVTIAGTSGALEDSANFTFDGTLLTVTGNSLVTGDFEVDGTATIAAAKIEALTASRVTLAGTDGVLEDSANLTFDGTTLTTTAASIDNIQIDGNTIRTSTGSLVLDPTPDGASGTVTIQGDLQVYGTTTTIDSTTVTVNDPIFTLGGDTAPASDDAKDRGIEFQWHDGTDAKVGFFGFDRSTSKFSFIPDATNTSEVFAGAVGDAEFANLGLATLDTTGDVTIGGTLGVTGATTLSDTLGVTGATTLSDTLGVTGAVTLNSTLSAGETILSSATISDLTSGRIILAGTAGAVEDSANLTFDGSTLTVTGAFVASGNISGADIDGTTITTTGSGSIGGTLGVTGNTTLSSDANIGGNLAVSGNSSITGNEDITGTLGVSGDTTLGENLAVTSNATVGGTFEVTGTSTLADIDAAAITAVTIDTTGYVTIGGYAQVDSTLDVIGHTTLSTATISTLTVGDMNITNVLSDLNVQGEINGGTINIDDITIAGNRISTTASNADLEIVAAGTGSIELLNTTNITGDLNVTGNTDITGNLTLGGNITIGDADTDAITVNADFTGNLIPDVDGTYDIGSDTKRWSHIYTDDLSVTNGISLDSTVIGNIQIAVTDDNTIDTTTGNLTLNSADGTITLDDDVSVSGTLEAAATTLASAKVSDLTAGRVVLAGTDGEIEDSANLTFDGSVFTVTGDAEITGNLTLGGNITIGDADTDSITVAADFESNLIPSDNITYDLGSDAKRWRDLYLSGDSIYLGDLQLREQAGQLTVTSDGITLTDFSAAAINAGTLILDDLRLDGNLITTTESNSNLEINAAGTGIVDILTELNVEGVVTAESFISDGTGVPTIESLTNIVLDAGNAVIAEIGGTEIARVVSTGFEITQGGITTPTLTTTGQTTIGNANTDLLTVNSRINTALVPDASNSRDLGTSSLYWGNAYITDVFSATITATNGITGDLTGNADTATALETARNITLQGDVAGTVSFNGESDAIINATIQANSVALGTDTTGNYVATITDDGAGTLNISGSGIESGPVTIGLSNTGVSAATYGNAQGTKIPFFTVDTYGRITAAGESNVATTLSLTDGTNTDTVDLLNDTLSVIGTASEVDVIVSDNQIQVGLPNSVQINTNLQVGNDLTISGNLTVQGSTTTVETTVVTLEDPVIRLGVSDLTTNDGKDRGNEFLYHTGLAQKRGFFGWDNATGRFTYIPDSTNTSENFSGTRGDAEFGMVYANLTGNVTGNVSGTAGSWATARTVTFTGDVAGNFSIDGSANVSDVALTVQPNSVALGTDTTGQYASTVAVTGNGLSITSPNADDGTAYTITSNATANADAGTLVVRDSSGNFSANVITADLSGTATAADNITVTENSTTNETVYLAFVDSASGNAQLEVDTGLTYNPAGGVLSTTQFSGSLAGNLTSSGGQIVLNTGTDGTNAFFTGDVKSQGGTTILDNGTDGTDAVFTGDVTGDVTGDLTGDVTGNLTGNVTGDVIGDTTGYHTGDVKGSIFGDDSTLLVDAINNIVTATISGDITGDIYSNDGTKILENGTDGTDATFTGLASEATKLATPVSFSLSGDVVANAVSFDGSSNIILSTTIQPNSVALGTDTTGNYVVDATGGTGVTVTHTPGEASVPSIAIGQDVSTTADVTFNDVTVNGTFTSDNITATTLTTSGSLTVTGDLIVSGTTTTVNTEEIKLADNIIELNSNLGAGNIPSQDAGLLINRGALTDVTITWNESTDKFEFKNAAGTPVYQTVKAGAFEGDITGSVKAADGTVILDNGTDGTDATFTGDITGDVTGNVSGTAGSWATTRTVTFAGGDVTGSFDIDGSADVSNVALTIGANSVALGTDTTGNYVASISNSSNITASGVGSETATATLDLTDTGVSADTYGSTTAIPVITVDAKGRITSVTTQAIATSFGISDGTSSDQVAGGETITFTGGTGVSTAVTNNEVTIDLADTTVTSGTYGTATAIPSFTVDAQGRITGVTTNALVETLDISDGSNTTTIDLLTETLSVAGTSNETTVTVSDNAITVGLADNINIAGILTVGGDTTLNADLTVGGSLTLEDASAISINASSTISAARFETDMIQIDDNYITSVSTNTDLELRAAGTGSVLIPGNTLEVTNNTTIGGTLDVTGATTTAGITASGAIAANASGNSLTVADTLRIAQTGSGLRMTNVGAFDNDGSDNFRVYATNTLYLRANGETGGGIVIDATNQNVSVDNDLIVTGDLTVQGTTTTVNSTVTTTEDPVLRVGVSGLSASDGKDRGIEFLHWDTSAKRGFFGLDEGTGRFTFIPNATNTSEVFSGTAGDASFNRVYAALTGNVTGQVSDISNFDTDDLTEGTKKFFTNTLARAAISVTDAGGDGSLAYNNTTGVLTYTGPSAADVRAHFSATGDLTYNQGTGEFSVTTYKTANFNNDFNNKTTDDLTQGSTNLYFTNARARTAISLTDTGGDGSMTYNANTGVFTYNGPTAGEVRAHLSASGDISYNSTTGVISFTERTDAEVRGLLSADTATGITYNNTTGEIGFDNTVTDFISLNDLSAGTGVTIASGEISIGQAVGTTDDVTFNNVAVNGTLSTDDITAATVTASGNVVISGNLTVNGTTTTVNTSELAVEDINITIANGAEDATAANGAGLTADLGTDGTATFTYDSVNDRWAMNKSLATNLVGNVTGDVTGTVSDISNHTTTDLTEGDNLYYTDTRVREAVSATGDLSYNDSTGVFSVTTYKTADFTTDLAAASVDGIGDVNVTDIKPGQYLRYGGSFGDTEYANTLLLIPANGAEASTTFLDESSVAGDITANGDAQITQTNKKFGTGSLLLDGTGDYLSVTRTAIGASDFTIDFWIYHDSSVGGVIYAAQDATEFEITGALGINDSTGAILTAVSLTPNTWYYVSITRDSGTLYRHINGTLNASAAYTTTLTATDWTIGGNTGTFGTTGYVNGNIDDFRVTTVARFGSANYLTPERAAYTYAGSLGTAFENVTPEINDLVDVDTTGVVDGQVLIYNSASDTFKPGSEINIGGVLSDFNIAGSLTVGETIYGANTLELEDITISGNQIRTTASNANLELSVAGTGEVDLLNNTNVTGNATVSGTIDVDGQATIASLNVEDLTSNQIVVPGTNGELEGSSNLTFDGTTFVVGSNVFTVANATGNTAVSGTLDVTGESTLASATISDLTDGRVTYAGTNGALVDSANFTFDGTTLTVPSISAATGATLPTLAVSDLTDNRIVIAGTSGELEDSAQLTFDSSLLNVDANATITGNAQINGNIDLGATTAQTITFGGRVDSHIVPSTTNTYDLGTDDIRWNDLYLNGNSIYLGDVTMSKHVDGGLMVHRPGTDTMMDIYSDTAFVSILDAGDIQIDTNVIQTTVSNADLELRTNGTGAIELQSDTNVTGAVTISSTVDVTGETTLASATISDLTSGRVVLAGTDGTIEDSTNLTFDGSTLAITGAQTISSTLDVDGQATVASLNVEDLTATRITFSGTNGELEDNANLTFASDTLTLAGTLDVTGEANVDDININGSTIGTTTGSLTIDPDTAGSGGTVTIAGNLTVQGTTTTVDSTTVTIDDPIFTLGGDTAPTVNDAKDKGIEFRWHDGANAKLGFFGYDESTGKFTFKPDATNTSEVFSGTAGDVEFNDATFNDIAASSLTLTNDLQVAHGGTGVSTFTTKGILYGDGTNNIKVTDAAGTSDATTSNEILTVDAQGTPVWTDVIDEGTF